MESTAIAPAARASARKRGAKRHNVQTTTAARCGYCHNPHLIPPRTAAALEWRDVLAFLERRRGLFDAVVFSGGEPTLQAGIRRALTAVRSLGFKIGLHTGFPSFDNETARASAR